LTLVTAGRVGKPHGLDGSFYVERPRHPLPEGASLAVAGATHRIARRAGTDERPLIRLAGVEDPRPLRGEVLLIEDELAEGEWLAADLVGCRVPGLGTVTQVVDAPSCSVLELEDGTLIPLVGDAIDRIDLDAGEIHVNREFLG
jgi:16S rRNA processing protein RimM